MAVVEKTYTEFCDEIKATSRITLQITPSNIADTVQLAWDDIVTLVRDAVGPEYSGYVASNFGSLERRQSIVGYALENAIWSGNNRDPDLPIYITIAKGEGIVISITNEGLTKWDWKEKQRSYELLDSLIAGESGELDLMDFIKWKDTQRRYLGYAYSENQGYGFDAYNKTPNTNVAFADAGRTIHIQIGSPLQN